MTTREQQIAELQRIARATAEEARIAELQRMIRVPFKHHSHGEEIRTGDLVGAID